MAAAHDLLLAACFCGHYLVLSNAWTLPVAANLQQDPVGIGFALPKQPSQVLWQDGQYRPLALPPAQPLRLLEVPSAQQQFGSDGVIQQTRLEREIEKTQQVAGFLAQDAAMLSQQLSALGASMRNVPTQQASYLLPPEAQGMTNVESQVPYLPPIDAGKVELSTSNSSRDTPDANGTNATGTANDTNATNDNESEADAIKSAFWTLNHRLNDSATVIFWVGIFSMTFAFCTICCMCIMRRRARRAEQERNVL